MKLTTLDKIEEQLRASRGREVPDLTPPPGGWEAINAQLATGPTGERALVHQPATPSRMKWWVGGMGALLLVLAAVFMPPSVKQEAVVATQQALAVAETKVTDLEVAATIAEQKEREQKGDKAIWNREGTDSPANVLLGEVVKPAGKTRFNEQRNEPIVEQNTVVEQPEKPVGSNSSSGKAVDKNEAPVDMDVPEPAPVLRENKRDKANSTAVDIAQSRTAPSGAKPEIFADNSREVYLPLKLLSPLSGLALPKNQWPTDLKPMVARRLGLFKTRRLKPKPEWQLHGSISGFIGEDYDGTLAYDVAPAAGSGIFFVRPSGGFIFVEPDAVRGNSNRLEQIYLKVGVNRQTSSGFLFRSSIGLFRSKSFQVGPEGNLMPDEVEVKTAKNKTIVPVELGLQYTFLRRRRLKPYAGVHLIGYLNYLGVDESFFTEGATEEEGLVSRLSSQEFISSAPDLAITLGLQYQVSHRVSAGAFLWRNVGGSLFAQAPLGAEIRYSLK